MSSWHNGQDMRKKIRSNVLIVTSHPDDETLWFFGGIKKLSKNYDIEVLCLTHKRDSERASELLRATQNLNVKISFAELSDNGFYTLLSGVHKAIYEKIEKDQYSFIITHPPHGGEKPHPHHIQSFYTCRRLAGKKNIRFGFFSETLMPNTDTDSNTLEITFFQEVIFLRTYFKYLILYRNSGFGWSLEIFYELLRLGSSFFRKRNFSLFKFFPNLEYKIKALNKFESQLQFIKQYKSFASDTEFLYIEKPN